MHNWLTLPWLRRNRAVADTSPVASLPEPYCDLTFGACALHKLMNEYEFETVLDVGSGSGAHSAIFAEAGKQVTAIDFGTSVYAAEHDSRVSFVAGNYMQHAFDQQFGAIWACHVLEHQPNPNLFLKKLLGDCSEGGSVAITVPPLKHEIVGGHVTLWNAGLLLYQLVLAGNDCSGAAVLQYGYNISVIVRRVPVELPDLTFDSGDVRRLAAYFPAGLGEPFNGNIKEMNWGAK